MAKKSKRERRQPAAPAPATPRAEANPRPDPDLLALARYIRFVGEAASEEVVAIPPADLPAERRGQAARYAALGRLLDSPATWSGLSRERALPLLFMTLFEYAIGPHGEGEAEDAAPPAPPPTPSGLLLRPLERARLALGGDAANPTPEPEPDWGDLGLPSAAEIRMALVAAPYEVLAERLGLNARLKLLASLDHAIEPERGELAGFYPFIFLDPNPLVVARAARAFALRTPVAADDPFVGVEDLVGLLTIGERVRGETQAAIVQGILSLGDHRTLAILGGMWQLFGEDGAFAMPEVRPIGMRAVAVEYALRWMEDPEAPFPEAAAELLVRLLEQFPGQPLLEFEPPYGTPASEPAAGDGRSDVAGRAGGADRADGADRAKRADRAEGRAPGGPDGVEVGRWTAPEYARAIEPRLRRIAVDAGYPPTLDDAFRAWKIERGPADDEEQRRRAAAAYEAQAITLAALGREPEPAAADTVPRRLLDLAFAADPPVVALLKLPFAYLLAEVLAEAALLTYKDDAGAAEPPPTTDDARPRLSAEDAAAQARGAAILGGALRRVLGADVVGHLDTLRWALGEDPVDGEIDDTPHADGPGPPSDSSETGSVPDEDPDPRFDLEALVAQIRELGGAPAASAARGPVFGPASSPPPTSSGAWLIDRLRRWRSGSPEA